MKQIDGVVWIKGWFDGDFVPIESTSALIGRDIAATRQVITHGRLSSIERIAAPPDFSLGQAPLYQRSVGMVHLDDGTGKGWITQIYDLHIPEWASCATDNASSSSGVQAGRVVGWAYAKLLPPKPDSSEPQDLSRETSADRGAFTQPNPSQEDPTEGGASRGQGTSSPDPTQPAHGAIESPMSEANRPSAFMHEGPEPDVSGSQTPSAPSTSERSPCRVCGWGWPLLVGFLGWVICSWKWGLLAMAPFLLRCIFSFFPRRFYNKAFSFFVSSLTLLMGIACFALWIQRVAEDCDKVPFWSLLGLGSAVVISSRVIHCWIPCLLAFLWSIAILASCPSEPLRCSRYSDAIGNFQEKIEAMRTTLQGAFKPDREATDVAEQSNQDYPWQLMTLDRAEKDPSDLFDCSDSRRQKRPSAITLGEGALFELGSSDLSDQAEASLNRLGKLIQSRPAVALAIVGHADRTKHREGHVGNLRLSEARAERVTEWLIEKGYAKPAQVLPIGVGERFPIVDVDGEVKLNRRVEVRVLCRP